jgi:hypothetical protein
VKKMELNSSGGKPSLLYVEVAPSEFRIYETFAGSERLTTTRFQGSGNPFMFL